MLFVIAISPFSPAYACHYADICMLCMPPSLICFRYFLYFISSRHYFDAHCPPRPSCPRRRHAASIATPDGDFRRLRIAAGAA